MNKLSKVTAGLLAATLALLLPNMARADESQFSLKLEPGVAVPLTSPQAHRFDAGGAVAVTGLYSPLPWLAFGPTLGVIAIPSNISGVDTGTAYEAGLSGLVRRPYNNSGSNWFTAASPWAGVDGFVVKTGDLARPAASVGVGVSFPTSDARNLWIGPFARYENIFPTSHDVNLDSNDARLAILGVSFEWGPAAKKAAPPPPAPIAKKEEPKPVPPPVVQPAPRPTPAPPPPPAKFEITERVQFPFDSAVPLPQSNPVLAHVVQSLLAHTDYTVKVEGHASSEGPRTYNQKLSERRAESVRKYLVAHGVAANRITTVGFGEDRPVADNATEAGRRQNRRVEFEVTLTITGEKK